MTVQVGDVLPTDAQVQERWTAWQALPDDADRFLAVEEAMVLGHHAAALVHLYEVGAPTLATTIHKYWQRLAEALALLAEAEAHAEGAAATLILAGQVWHQHVGRVDQAITCWQQAWKRDTRRTDALRMARQAYVAEGQWPMARKLLAMELRLAPDEAARAELHEVLAALEASEATGGSRGEVQTPDAAANAPDQPAHPDAGTEPPPATAPEATPPTDGRAIATAAVDAATQALAAQADDRAALDVLWEHAPLIENWEAVAAAYEAALHSGSRSRPDATLLERLGAIQWTHLDRWDDALATFKRLRLADPKNRTAQHFWAEAYRRDSDWKRLGQTLQALIDAVGDDAATVGWRVELAQLCEDRLGNPTRAADLWASVRRSVPTHPDATPRLEALLEATGSWTRLLALHQEVLEGLAVDETARRVEVLGRIAAIYETRLQMPARVAEVWTEVLTLDPAHPQAVEATLHRFQAAGRTDEAVALLGRAAAGATGAERLTQLRRLVSVAAPVAAHAGEALDALEALVDAGQTDPETLGQLQQLYATTGRVDAGLRLERAQIATLSGDARRDALVSLFAGADAAAAPVRVSLANEVLAVTGYDHAAAFALVEADAVSRGDDAALVELLENRLARHPGTEGAVVRLARAQERLEATPLVRAAAWQRAAAEGGLTPDDERMRCRALVQADRWDDAEAAARGTERAETLLGWLQERAAAGGDAGLWMRVARWAAVVGQDQAVGIALSEAFGVEPTHEVAGEALQIWLAEHERFDELVEHLQRRVAHAPDAASRAALLREQATLQAEQLGDAAAAARAAQAAWDAMQDAADLEHAATLWIRASEPEAALAAYDTLASQAPQEQRWTLAGVDVLLDELQAPARARERLAPLLADGGTAVLERAVRASLALEDLAGAAAALQALGRDPQRSPTDRLQDLRQLLDVWLDGLEDPAVAWETWEALEASPGFADAPADTVEADDVRLRQLRALAQQNGQSDIVRGVSTVLQARLRARGDEAALAAWLQECLFAATDDELGALHEELAGLHWRAGAGMDAFLAAREALFAPVPASQAAHLLIEAGGSLGMDEDVARTLDAAWDGLDVQVQASVVAWTARALLNAQDASAAAALLDRTWGAHPAAHSDDAWDLWAQALTASQAWARAVEVLEQAAAARRDDERRASDLARAAQLYRERLGRTAQATRLLEDARALAPEAHGVLEALDGLYRDEGRWEPLADVLRARLRSEQDVAVRRDLHLRLATVLESQLGRAEEAVTTLQTSVQQDGASLEVLLRLEAANGRMERYAAQVGWLDQAIALALEPEVKASAALRAGDVAAAQLEDLARAVGFWDTAAAAGAEPDDVLRRLRGASAQAGSRAAFDAELRLLRRLERLELVAEAQLARGLDARVDEEERLTLLAEAGGLLQDTLGDPATALQAWMASLALRPYDAAWLTRAWTAAAAADAWGTLAETLEDLVDGHGERVALRIRLAELYRDRLRRSEQAVALLRALVSEHPDYDEPWLMLDSLLLEAERWTEWVDVAHARLARPLEAHDRYDLVMRLARVQRGVLGDNCAAAACLTGLLDEDPTQEDALDLLEETCQDAGDWAGLADVWGRRATVAGAEEAVTLRLEQVRALVAADAGPEATALLAQLQVTAPESPWQQGALRAVTSGPLAARRDVLAWLCEQPLDAAHRYGALDTLVLLAEHATVASPSICAHAWRLAAGQRAAQEVYDQAVLFLVRAIVAAPQDGDPEADTAAIVRWSRDAEDVGAGVVALEEIASTVADGPWQLAAYRRAARLLSDGVADLAAAVAAWRRVWSLVPGDAEAREALDLLLSGARDWNALAQLLSEVSASETTPDLQRRAAARRRAAILRDQLGAAAEAVAVLTALVAAHPDDDEAHAQLAAIAVEEGRFTDAIEAQRAMLAQRTDPAGRVELLTNIARLQQDELGDIPGALDTWEALVAEPGGQEPARLGLSQVLTAGVEGGQWGPVLTRTATLLAPLLVEADDRPLRIEVLHAQIYGEQDPHARIPLRVQLAGVNQEASRFPQAAAVLREGLQECGPVSALLDAVRSLVTVAPEAAHAALAFAAATSTGDEALDLWDEAFSAAQQAGDVERALEYAREAHLEVPDDTEVRDRFFAALATADAWTELAARLADAAEASDASTQRDSLFARAVEAAEHEGVAAVVLAEVLSRWADLAVERPELAARANAALLAAGAPGAFLDREERRAASLDGSEAAVVWTQIAEVAEQTGDLRRSRVAWAEATRTGGAAVTRDAWLGRVREAAGAEETLAALDAVLAAWPDAPERAAWVEWGARVALRELHDPARALSRVAQAGVDLASEGLDDLLDELAQGPVADAALATLEARAQHRGLDAWIDIRLRRIGRLDDDASVALRDGLLDAVGNDPTWAGSAGRWAVEVFRIAPDERRLARMAQMAQDDRTREDAANAAQRWVSSDDSARTERGSSWVRVAAATPGWCDARVAPVALGLANAHPEVTETVEAAVQILGRVGDFDAVCDVLETASWEAADDAARGTLLRRAADLAWERLQDAARARDLLERAMAAQPDAIELLGAWEVLLEASGDHRGLADWLETQAATNDDADEATAQLWRIVALRRDRLDDLVGAARALQALRGRLGDDPAVLSELVALLAGLEDRLPWTEAALAWLRVTPPSAQTAPLRRALANTYETQLGDLEAALTQWEALHAEGEADARPAMLRLLAELQRWGVWWSVAEAHLQTVAKDEVPSLLREMTEAAVHHLAEVGRAVPLWEQLVVADPQDEATWDEWLEATAAEDDGSDAFAVFARAVAVAATADRTASLWSARATRLRASGHDAAARGAIRAALVASPSASDARTALEWAAADGADEDEREALAHLRTLQLALPEQLRREVALERTRGDGLGAVPALQALASRGIWEDAAILLQIVDALVAVGRAEDAVGVLPTDPTQAGDRESQARLSHARGRTLEGLGRHGEAAAAYEHAAHALPRWFANRVALGRALAGDARVDEAAKALQTALVSVVDAENDAQRCELFVVLADVRIRSGDLGRAHDMLHRAQALLPADPRVVALGERLARG